jgi:hypothetical protein
MRTPDWLTLVVTLVWIVSLAVRVLIPSAASVFIGTDAAVLVVIGYWFSANGLAKRRNGNGKSI